MNCCKAVHDGCWLTPIVLMPLPQLSAVVAPVTVQAHFAPGYMQSHKVEQMIGVNRCE